MQPLDVILIAFAGYVLLGVLFAVPFLLFMVSKLDAHAAGASLRFKLTVLPGCVALWPLLLAKVLRRRA
ncbi:MAG: hypothetical protein AAF747_06070 [Planctomycetota bacterium]